MADENTTTTTTDKDKGDQFGNFKAEVNRKIDGVKDALQQTTQELKAQLTALIPKVHREVTQQPPTQKKTFKDLVWEDEEAAANLIKQDTTQTILKILDKKERQNQVIGGLFSDFPELKDMGHALTKKALEIYNALPDEDKDQPSSYRLAVLEAAHNEGIIPMSKRKREDEDDSDAWTSGGGGSKRKRQSKAEADLPAETLEFATLMGLDIADEKVLARLKKSAARNWTRYSKP